MAAKRRIRLAFGYIGVPHLLWRYSTKKLGKAFLFLACFLTRGFAGGHGGLLLQRRHGPPGSPSFPPQACSLAPPTRRDDIMLAQKDPPGPPAVLHSVVTLMAM